MKKYDLFAPEWVMWQVLRCIRDKIYIKVCDYSQLSYEKLVYENPGSYKKVEQGLLSRKEILDGDYMYRLTVPAQNISHAYLLCRTGGGEGEVLVDGRIKGSVDYLHQEIFLGDLRKEQDLQVFLTRNYQQYSENYRQADIPREEIIFQEISLCTACEHTKRLFYLGQLLFESAVSYQRPDLYQVLKKYLYQIDEEEEPEAFNKRAEQLLEAMLRECRLLPACEEAGYWMCSAHSHLDLLFHWSEKDTIRKIGRTLSNTVSFLRRYPGNLYTQSQMQLLAWCQEYFPDLFQEVRLLVGKGEISLIGDFWCEADTYLPHTECWIRQCLYGKAYAKENFDSFSRTAYMPDTFGFNPVLPQILQNFGYDYFTTTKLAWNDTTPFPYQEFIWQGLDGTQMKSYQYPGFYSGPLDCDTLDYTRAHISRASKAKEHVFHYGAGDGGGGVNEEMLLTKEMFRKVGILDTFEDLCVDKALDRIFEGAEAPVVEGELYLQKHRGTYTNQGELKLRNRKSEILMKNAEAVNAIWNLGQEKVLEHLFKKLLLCQFHDTMAGTMVDEALADARRHYEEIQEGTRSFFQGAGPAAIFHNQDHTRDVLVAVRVQASLKTWGNFKSQTIREEADGTKWILILLEGMKPYEVRVLPEEVLEVAENTNLYAEKMLHSGQIDFQHEIEAYFDRGGYFDSWDINSDYENYPLEGQQTETMGILEEGPLRKVSVREITGSWGSIRQYRSDYSFTSRIDFYNEMEVTKMHCIVKAAFEASPGDTFRQEEALFDMGYGYVKRRTSREAIQKNGTFETAHQKWMKLGKTAILNDCKYGCDVCEGKMRLTLVKTSDFPGKSMDIGMHRMTYSLYQSDSIRPVVDEAEALNNPYCVLHMDSQMESPILDCSSVKIGWIKKAQDGQGILIRLYECEGRKQEASITLADRVQRVFQADMQERILQEWKIQKKKVAFPVRAFEIITLLLK